MKKQYAFTALCAWASLLTAVIFTFYFIVATPKDIGVIGYCWAKYTVSVTLGFLFGAITAYICELMCHLAFDDFEVRERSKTAMNDIGWCFTVISAAAGIPSVLWIIVFLTTAG